MLQVGMVFEQRWLAVNLLLFLEMSTVGVCLRPTNVSCRVFRTGECQPRTGCCTMVYMACDAVGCGHLAQNAGNAGPLFAGFSSA